MIKMISCWATIALAVGLFATDDLFAFLDPLDREANWCDECHHNVQLCPIASMA